MNDIESPAETVLLFDANAPHRSFAGGAQDLARERHLEEPTVIYADGHTRNANTYTMAKLLWTPKEAPKQAQAGRTP